MPRSGEANMRTNAGAGDIITKANTVFIVISFEGPDQYSMAGGLGTRVTHLSRSLAEMGFVTHFFFIGDPNRPGEGTDTERRLHLYRWCQWISKYHHMGVYDGENQKLRDFNGSLPPFVTERVVKPALDEGKLVVILGEEWHTAEAMIHISDLLRSQAVRDRVVMFWNANNTFGFDRIDWHRLARESTITTVSRYMKHNMWRLGVNPLVIPNGIPVALLNRVDDHAAGQARAAAGGDVLLTKVARYDPDKRWKMAIEATAMLKYAGQRSILLARGGIEPHGREVMDAARALGLILKEVYLNGESPEDYPKAIQNQGGADILELKSPCSQDFLRLLYRASDAVLANSRHEPFGLVGLETMAAGGIAFLGGTGEDYANHLRNCVVLETEDPEEIGDYAMYLLNHPHEAERIREEGRNTASQFTWGAAIANLIRKLEYQAQVQGVLERSPLRREKVVKHTEGRSDSAPLPATVASHQPVLAGSV